MRIVGIDLAAAAKNTGIAILRGGKRPIIESAHVAVDDDDLIEAVCKSDRVGVDVPLGWPTPFVDLMRGHEERAHPVPASTGIDWRRNLAMRTTDFAVHQRTGITPLSVSADRIAYPAFRWTGIEARLRDLGIDVARDGSGVVYEVYPAATLRCWSLPHRGYKGLKNAKLRVEIVDALTKLLPLLDWNGHQELCIADDNVLDAVIAALTAREATLGRCVGPPADVRDIAIREGWIWLPARPEHGVEDL